MEPVVTALPDTALSGSLLPDPGPSDPAVSDATPSIAELRGRSEAAVAEVGAGGTVHRLRPLALRPVPPPEAVPAKRCPAGHPNDVEATACRLCETALDPAAAVVDVRPEPLARLLLEDGTAIDLVADLVIGRCPGGPGSTDGFDQPGDGTVRSSGAHDTLTVSGRQVSRCHLVVEPRGWRLLVRDTASTNGTFVTRRGERGRRRVPEERAVTLRIGDTIHFGTRQALVVAARPG
jgi:hypothetical protein